MTSDIPVIILCGGKGTRLREETEIKPKPMVEIAGKPILWHIIKSYSHYGFNNFILALGYKGDVIKDYFYHYRITANDFTVTFGRDDTPQLHSSVEPIPWRITCVDTGYETLKTGRIKRLEPFIKTDRFHLTYGDGVSNIDIKKLDEFHSRHQCLGTVTSVRPPGRFGEITVDGDYVTRFEEKPQVKEGQINGGFYVFKKEFLGILKEEEDRDLEFGILPELAARRQLKAFRHEGFWQCMDNVRDKDYLESLWQEGTSPWKVW